MPQQAVSAPQAPAPEPALPPESAASDLPGLPPRRWSSRHTYGAIDLGTNNCRLLIARPSDDGFTVIDAFSRVVRMGEGMATSGKLAEGAMDRAVSALSVCAEKLRRRRVSLARSVATEACRRAVNGRHFVERVKRETGICLEIISPEEEARLAMLGCHRLLEPGDGPALIFDIGGGSTELVLAGEDETPQASTSLDVGCVRVTERFLASDPPSEQELAEAAAFVRALLPPFDARSAIGVAGTVTTLATLDLGDEEYDPKRTHGHRISRDSVADQLERLAAMTTPERERVPGIEPGRAPVIVAGAVVLLEILDAYDLSEIEVSERDILHGAALAAAELPEPEEGAAPPGAYTCC
jgi:exopolyphosphatase / guanosine-5'-triphosphate,3'-diphosphate pyrophosphatase